MVRVNETGYFEFVDRGKDMIKRAGEPYAGDWALPGGYMEIDETLEAAAAREAREHKTTRVVDGGRFFVVHAERQPGRDWRYQARMVARDRLKGSNPHGESFPTIAMAIESAGRRATL